MAVPQKILIFNVIAPTQAESGNVIMFDVGLRSNFDTQQQVGAELAYFVESFPLTVATSLIWFEPLQSKYRPITITMPSQNISVMVRSKRYDYQTGSIVIDQERGPYHVQLIEAPTITIPAPPEGPFVSPSWLVNLLATLLGAPSANAIVDYGVGVLNNLFDPLVAVRNAFLDAARVIEADGLLLHAFLAQKDLWLAQQSKLWADRTLAEADALDKAQSVTLWNSFVSALQPWEYLRDHSVVNTITDAVFALGQLFASLPGELWNFFSNPVDWIFDTVEGWLFGEE